jgi:hypothetical protein
MPVPNTFANATATIPLSQLDANFATTITLGNTAIQLGNTVSTLNNMTLANVTVTSGNVTLTNVTVTTANVTTANIATATIANASVSGNLAFTSTGNRITGDFSNATAANNLMFQTSTLNGNTNVGAIPNGTATVARYFVYSNSDPTNASFLAIEANGGAGVTAINSSRNNAGAFLPMTFFTSGSEKLRIAADATGTYTFGGTAPRITGDFSNATLANRVMFQNSVTNGSSNIQTLPNGTSSVSGLLAFANSDPANTSFAAIQSFGAEVRVTAGITGTATHVPMTFFTGGSEAMRIDSSGKVGISASSLATYLQVGNGSGSSANYIWAAGNATNPPASATFGVLLGSNRSQGDSEANIIWGQGISSSQFLGIGKWTGSAYTEQMRIDSSGHVLVGKTTTDLATAGTSLESNGVVGIGVGSVTSAMFINRQSNDGTLIQFRQANVDEGNISVSGTAVSYNGGHLSRWSQTADNTRIELLKGTVMSNLDQMAEWIDPETGEPQANEQLNCMKVSDVEGDVNVAGVFVNWDNDDDVFANDMNVAMTGDMIIRIAQGVTIQRGDLLMSAGDGTAKPQGDDIIRSKTVAKVTSTHVTCTYEDGSYCVPCVLMAC